MNTPNLRKRRMWPIILISLAVIIVVFLIIVALQPDEYHVSRSGTIPAAPAVVFEQINDFHNWQPWSPWAWKDPNAKNTFEGPPSGKGAIFRWAGNANVGEGSMTITESRPAELIRLRLDFLKPMAGTADTEFTFTPQAEGTLVNWTITGKKNFISKAVCMVMSMDKMIGGDFEAGLANLRSVLEPKAMAVR